MKHAFLDAFMTRLHVFLLVRISQYQKALQISGILSTGFCIPEMCIAVPQMCA